MLADESCLQQSQLARISLFRPQDYQDLTNGHGKYAMTLLIVSFGVY